jgi:hypothetical protein
MTLLDNVAVPAHAVRNGSQIPTASMSTGASRESEPKPALVSGDQAANSTAAAENTLPDARRHARWFFWMWLLFATAVSIGGNVMHAWMAAPATHLKILAASVAAVPPAVLLGSTHSVALLIKTRRRGYRCVDAAVLAAALVLTVGVAACAFAMSFFSVRDLMITLGMSVDTAWLWPIGVDLSLICSTLALLTLTSSENHDFDVTGFGTADSAAALAAGSGPSSPAERRLWWDSIAAVIQERHSDVRKIAELPAGTIAEILQRLYDDGDSQRSVCGAVELHHREVRTIKQTADEVLLRVAPWTGAAG